MRPVHRELPRKTSPSYWWDFKHYDDGQMSIIVQSDQPGGECLREFGPVGPGQSLETQEVSAQKLISDLAAGRITEKSLGN